MSEHARTLPEALRASAREWPDRVAVIDGADALTYRELNAQSDALACFIAARGGGRHGRVALVLDKGLEAVVALWSVMKAGAAFVAVNPRLTAEQVAYQVRHCRASCILASRDTRRLLPAPDDPSIVAVESFPDIFAAHAGDAPPPAPTPDDMAAIVYTSGTMGPPKGVMHSHRNLAAWNATVIEYLHHTPDDVIIGVLPLHSTYGLSQLFASLCAGATFVIQKSMLPAHICQTLAERRVTGFAGVPMTWIQLLQRHSPLRRMALPHLRYITNAGGALAPVHVQDLLAVLKHTQLFLMYGQTETLRTTMLEPAQLAARGVSLGKAIRGVDVHVVDEAGRVCADNQPGVLVHCGAHVFQGYWEDPEATARVRRVLPGAAGSGNGEVVGVWTGDIVTRDAEGLLHFVGRNDDMIKTAGYRVGPQEIEDVLHRLEAVTEAVVFGVPDDLLGQRIAAVVSCTDGHAPLAKEQILAYCRVHLPPYMVPADVHIAADLPKTSTGKPERARIKALYGARPT